MFRPNSGRSGGQPPKMPSRIQPMRQAKQSSVPAEPAKKEPITIMSLSTEILNQIFSHIPAGNTEAQDKLSKIALVNKRFKELVDFRLYDHLNVFARLTSDRTHENIELLTRSLLRNPGLRNLPKQVFFKMQTYEPTQGNPLYSARTMQFWTQDDLMLLRDFLVKICEYPIWDLFPGGKWLHGYEKRIAVVTGPKPVSDAKARAAEWYQDITLGRQDALVALMLVLCPRAQFIKFASWHEVGLFENQDGLNINDEDMNQVCRVLRAGANSQAKKMALPFEDREAFNEGVLLNVKTMMLKDCNSFQPANVVFPAIALPMLERAWVSITDTNHVSEIFSLPADTTIAFRLRKLELTGSHCSTASLVNILTHCPNLDTFTHTMRFRKDADRDFDSRNFDHRAVLSTLAKSCGKTLKVLVMAYTSKKSSFTELEAGLEWDLHFSSFDDARIHDWKPFTQLVRLQVPLEYVTGYHSMEFQEPLDLADILPPTLKTLEVLWSENLRPYSSVFSQLSNLIFRRNDNEVAKVAKIFLGDDLLERLDPRRGIQLRPRCWYNMLEAAKKHGVRIFQYAESEHLLPRDQYGPEQEVDLRFKRVSGGKALLTEWHVDARAEKRVFKACKPGKGDGLGLWNFEAWKARVEAGEVPDEALKVNAVYEDDEEDGDGDVVMGEAGN